MKTLPNAALAELCVNFLITPGEGEKEGFTKDELNEALSSLEEQILEELNKQLRSEGFIALPDGFIEWGCIEHNTIHILAFAGSQWIEIDPETGIAQTL